MYCPNCKQEYDGKFCPECGTKLIEKPDTSGVSLSLGDANAISGGLHVNDSHAVHNEDKSVHNITNTTSTVNNISNVAAQKTEMELLQEKKALYLTECKRAYEDNVLEQSEVVVLEECRIKLGLDKSTADAILESVRVMSDRNARKSELTPIAKTKLKILTENLQKNEVRALMDQIDSLEPLVRRYDNDELSRKYYLVLSALKPERCIEQRESTKTDSYWESFWTYLAYIKTGRQLDADETLAGMDRFTSYPEDNITVLAAAGELIKGHEKDSREYLTSVTGEYTPALQRFVDSINLLLDPEKTKESGADENTCAFYLVNFFGQKDPKAKVEEERLRKEREEAEEERRKAEEAKRKADAERLRREREEFERKKRAEEERLQKEREEIERRRAEEERRKAEEAKRKADAERLRKEREEFERKKRAEEERLQKEREEIERRRAEEERRKAEEAKRKADAERLKKEKEEAERKKKAEEERLRKEREEIERRRAEERRKEEDRRKESKKEEKQAAIDSFKIKILWVTSVSLSIITGILVFISSTEDGGIMEGLLMAIMCTALPLFFFIIFGLGAILGMEADPAIEEGTFRGIEKWRTWLCRISFSIVFVVMMLVFFNGTFDFKYIIASIDIGLCVTTLVYIVSLIIKSLKK